MLFNYVKYTTKLNYYQNYKLFYLVIFQIKAATGFQRKLGSGLELLLLAMGNFQKVSIKSGKSYNSRPDPLTYRTPSTPHQDAWSLSAP